MNTAKKILERSRKYREDSRFILREDFTGVTSIGNVLKKYESLFLGEFVSAIKSNYNVLPKEVKDAVKEDQLIKIDFFEKESKSFNIHYVFPKNDLNNLEHEFNLILAVDGDNIKLNFEYNPSDEKFFTSTEISSLFNTYSGLDFKLSEFDKFVDKVIQFNRDLVYLYINYLQNLKMNTTSISYKQEMISNFMDYLYEELNREVFNNKVYEDNVNFNINKKNNTLNVSIYSPDRLSYIIMDYVFSPAKGKFVMTNYISNGKEAKLKGFKHLFLDNTIEFVSALKVVLGEMFKDEFVKANKVKTEDVERNDITIEITRTDDVARKIWVRMNGSEYEYEVKDANTDFAGMEKQLRNLLGNNINNFVPFVLSNLKIVGIGHSSDVQAVPAVSNTPEAPSIVAPADNISAPVNIPEVPLNTPDNSPVITPMPPVANAEIPSDSVGDIEQDNVDAPSDLPVDVPEESGEEISNADDLEQNPMNDEIEDNADEFDAESDDQYGFEFEAKKKKLNDIKKKIKIKMESKKYRKEESNRNDWILLVDSRAGIYIPKEFAEKFTVEDVEGGTEEDWDILKSGPDNELYWDVWDSVLNKVVVFDKKGKRYNLNQDEDLWAVPENYEYNDVFESKNYEGDKVMIVREYEGLKKEEDKEEDEVEEMNESLEKNEIIFIANESASKDIIRKIKETGEPEGLVYAFEKYGRVKKESRYYTDNIEKDLKVDHNCIMVQLKESKMIYNEKENEVILLKALDEGINKTMKMMPGIFKGLKNEPVQNYQDLKEARDRDKLRRLKGLNKRSVKRTLDI